MDRQELIPIISASRIGQKLSENACKDFAGRLEILNCSKNYLLFQEGDIVKGIYIVADGVVKLLRYRSDGNETILHIAKTHDVIAEGALFLGHYPATAITDTETKLLFLRKESAMELLQNHTTFSLYMYESMALWQSRLVSKIDQLTLNDATARIVRYLLGLYEENKPKVMMKKIIVSLPVKKGDLATLLNMNQATLSRTLRRLQDMNLIKVKGRTFELDDLDALEKLTLPPLD
ncbi:MAG: Crp/Fnr family transcriptional regulator [Candidatus Electryonea clarkiae]|nr:Crp/Fnr family transcriptional regulator [Candidatus Electryonea clarkiae]MDP8287203.1 Crp/Fnr family transcriptional regulator [Candidatus Electryonea clarkiae]